MKRSLVCRKFLSLMMKNQFASYGPEVLYGDTPNCSMQSNFEGIDEITPGNFVFYDLMQASIGACRESDIALALICPVVSKYTDTGNVVFHGGAVHFSKEVLSDSDGTTHFGKLAQPTDSGWQGMLPGCYLGSISQEHGLTHVSDQVFSEIEIGDVIYVYPAHSCLSADLMKSYLTTDEVFFEGTIGPAVVGSYIRPN